MTPDFKDLAQIYQQRALESLSEEDLAHAKRYRIAAELEADIKSEQQWASFYAQESLGRKARVEQLEAVLRVCRATMQKAKYNGSPYTSGYNRAIAKINRALNQK